MGHQATEPVVKDVARKITMARESRQVGLSPQRAGLCMFARGLVLFASRLSLPRLSFRPGDTPNPAMMSDAMAVEYPLSAVAPPSEHEVLVSRANLSRIRRASSLPMDIKRTYRTGYVYDEGMLSHKHSTEEHPEQPDRIKRIFEIFQENGLIARMRKLPFLPVRRNRVMLVHSADLWEKVHNIAGERAFESWKMILISKLFYSDDPAGNS